MERLPGGRVAIQSFRDKLDLGQTLSMDAEWTEKCWDGRTEGILKAHFKCFTHMNSGGYIHPACPLASKPPWDVLTQEMALVIRCELIQSKKLAWATKAILPLLFGCTPEVGLGFLQGAPE